MHSSCKELENIQSSDLLAEKLVDAIESNSDCVKELLNTSAMEVEQSIKDVSSKVVDILSVRLWEEEWYNKLSSFSWDDKSLWQLMKDKYMSR